MAKQMRGHSQATFGGDGPGPVGTVMTVLEPGQLGRVRVHGVYWRAMGAQVAGAIPAGAMVRVLERRGLTLMVTPLQAAM